MEQAEPPTVTLRDVRAMLDANDATLVDLMRRATADPALAAASFSEWEHSFLRDVAARASSYRYSLTPKQRAKVQHILSKPAALLLLTELFNAEAEGRGEQASMSESSHAPEPPAPTHDYAADPSWGIF